jgi:Glycogen recognition site of AMP-activated protein kinase
MAVEPDDVSQDPTLRRVIAELRKPVTLDAEPDRRALAEIRAARRPPVVGRRLWLGAAIAAGIALVLLTRTPFSSTPDGRAHPIVETRPVRLRLAAPASRVSVVGDFNDWDPAATPLRRDGGSWTVELHLKPGRYHYTFLIDGRRWASDPAEPRATESDYGAPMSVLTVS